MPGGGVVGLGGDQAGVQLRQGSSMVGCLRILPRHVRLARRQQRRQLSPQLRDLRITSYHCFYQVVCQVKPC